MFDNCTDKCAYADHACSPTGKFSTMGPYSGNKVFEMASLYWFNKKAQINDTKINSRKVRVITRSGVITKERKGTFTGKSASKIVVLCSPDF